MGKQAILCVDDEPLILLALKLELSRRFGGRFVYEMASDAAEALELIEGLAADGVEIAIIVSDWFMPGMKGDELLELVHERHPGIGAIIISGQADEDAIARIERDCRLLAFFGKPYDPNKVFQAIEAYCASREPGLVPGP